MKNAEKNLSQQNRKFVKEMAYGKPKIMIKKRETHTHTRTDTKRKRERN